MKALRMLSSGLFLLFALAAGNAMAQQYVSAYDAGSPGAAYIVVSVHLPLPSSGPCTVLVNPHLKTPDYPLRAVDGGWVGTVSDGTACTATVIFQGDATGAGNVWAMAYYQYPERPSMFPREVGWAYVGWY